MSKSAANVIDLNAHICAFTQEDVVRDPNDMFFPVSLRPAFTGVETDGEMLMIESPEYVSVFREDTHKTLSMPRSSYHLVKNEDVFPMFEEALAESGLNLDGMQHTDLVAFEGGLSVRSYILPAYTKNIKGDDIAMQLRVVNSYNGTHPFSAHIGGIRVTDDTHIVVGHKYSEVYGRHTANLDVMRVINKISGAMKIFMENLDTWALWTEIPVTDEQAINVLQEIPQAGERMVTKMFERFLIEKQNLGGNVWALFNTLSHWATHAKLQSKSANNRVAKVMDREKKVRTALKSRAFTKLIAGRQTTDKFED